MPCFTLGKFGVGRFAIEVATDEFSFADKGIPSCPCFLAKRIDNFFASFASFAETLKPADKVKTLAFAVLEEEGVCVFFVVGHGFFSLFVNIIAPLLLYTRGEYINFKTMKEKENGPPQQGPFLKEVHRLISDQEKPRNSMRSIL